MRELDGEREYAERCREALRRMVAGARENVVVGEDTWGDRYTAERLGYYLKTLARDLGEEGDNPPFFGADRGTARSPAPASTVARRTTSAGGTSRMRSGARRW